MTLSRIDTTNYLIIKDLQTWGVNTASNISFAFAQKKELLPDVTKRLFITQAIQINLAKLTIFLTQHITSGNIFTN